MTELNETANWEDVLHGIAVEEPLRGGEDGPLNRAVTQLGNRTLYLKEHVDEIEGLIERGAGSTLGSDLFALQVEGDGILYAYYDEQENPPSLYIDDNPNSVTYKQLIWEVA